MGNPVALEASALERLHTRVHFNHHNSAGFGIHRKLNIRAACIYADFSDYSYGLISKYLIFFIGQSLGGCHSYRIAGMDPHGIKILD